MGIKEAVTVTQYNIGKLVFTGQNAATLKALVTIELYNANSNYLGTKRVELDLSPAEKNAIISNVAGRMQQLESLTGWTRYILGEIP